MRKSRAFLVPMLIAIGIVACSGKKVVDVITVKHDFKPFASQTAEERRANSEDFQRIGQLCSDAYWDEPGRQTDFEPNYVNPWIDFVGDASLLLAGEETAAQRAQRECWERHGYRDIPVESFCKEDPSAPVCLKK